MLKQNESVMKYLPKEPEEIYKIWIGNETRKTKKKLWQQAKVLKIVKLTKSKLKEMTTKRQLQTSKDISVRRERQKIPKQGQAIQTKQDLALKKRKKIILTNWFREQNDQMQKKQNKFGVKYGNRKYIIEMLNG